MASMLDLISPQDQQELRRASMLSFASGMLQNSGWQPRPVGLGQAVGAGIQNYQQTRSQMLPQMMNGAMLQRQVAREDDEQATLKDLRESMDPGPWREVGPGTQERRGIDEGRRDAALSRLMPKEMALRSLPPVDEEYTLTPGAGRFRGGKQIAGMPEAPQKPDFVTLQKQGGEPVTLQTTDPQVRNYLLRGYTEAKTPAAQISIDQRSETEADKAEGQVVGKAGGDIIVAGNRASETIAQISRLDQLANAYEQVGGDFSPYAEAKLKAATFLPEWARQQIGITDAEIGTGQALMAEANRQVLGLIGPGGFPANNFSEADRKFLLTIPPRLNDMGFRAKLIVAQRVAERQEAMGDKYRELRSMGNPVAQAMALAQQQSRQQPLFTEQDQRIIANDRAPQMGGDLSAQAKAAWGTYEPDKYEYRTNEAGVLQRRLKQ
jgi:hypothetical protein